MQTKCVNRECELSSKCSWYHDGAMVQYHRYTVHKYCRLEKSCDHFKDKENRGDDDKSASDKSKGNGSNPGDRRGQAEPDNKTE